MIQYVQGGDILELSEGDGLKVVALVGGGDWSKKPGSLTARISARWTDGKMSPAGWHRACFRWMKMNNNLGDVQWTCVEYKLAICFMVSEYTRHGINYETLESCLDYLGTGAKALADSQKTTATIHMPALENKNEFEWMIQDQLEDFDIFLYE